MKNLMNKFKKLALSLSVRKINSLNTENLNKTIENYLNSYRKHMMK